jgi:nucleoside-diphosphate-sugar epimerase
MKLILVTGSDGWLGSRLMEILAHDVPAASIRTFHGDLRNPEDCRRFCDDAKDATLFHAAGVIHPRRVRDFYDINVAGIMHLLDAAVAGHIRRAVVVSSNSPCGCNPHPDHLFDEHSPYHPHMNYGYSKMLMEIAVRKRHNRGDLQTVIIRAPWFYGPNQPPRQTLFFKMVRDGKAPIVGGGNNLRSMAYLDNLCQGLLLAATVERADGQTYWIADEQPYSMNEIIDTVERLLEQEFGVRCAHKRLRLPGFVSEIALLADMTIQGFGFYNQKIHVLSEMNKTIACSIAKAANELGYKPAIALEEGMRRSLHWCADKGITFKD